MMNPVVVGNHFQDMGTLTEELQLNGKSHLTWNANESGFNFQHEPLRVVARKGTMPVSVISAVGRALLLMMVVKGKTSRRLHTFATFDASL